MEYSLIYYFIMRNLKVAEPNGCWNELVVRMLIYFNLEIRRDSKLGSIFENCVCNNLISNNFDL